MQRKINHLLTPAIKTGMTPGKRSRLESANSIVKHFGANMPSIISQVDIDPIRMKARQAWIDEAERIAAVSLFSAIESLDEHEAVVTIETDNEYFEVVLGNDGEGLVHYCNCEFPESSFCPHKIAASLMLMEVKEAIGRQESVSREPWQEKLSRLVNPQLMPTRPKQSESILFFSMVPWNGVHEVRPCTLPADLAPRELYGDRKELQRYLVRGVDPARLREAKEIKLNELHRLRFVNSTPNSLSMIKLALDHSTNYRYFYSMPKVIFWEGLVSEMVFTGRKDDLVGEPLRILPGVATVEMDLNRIEEGLRVSLVAVTANGRVRMHDRDLSIFYGDPLWLRYRSIVFQSDLNAEQYRAIRQESDVVVPTESLGEFYDSRYQSITTTLPVNDSALPIEEAPCLQPTIRLCLIEEKQNLNASLRFVYGRLEVTAQSKGQPFSYHYDPEQQHVTKIARHTQFEKEWYERIGGDEFGLKPGFRRDSTKPDIFLLRKGVHPYDFLTTRLPALIEAGVEIFGESELSSRVNKSRPNISFQVTSDVDWFDLKALVQWGDQNVPLEEMRRALRRNDRFIKLADGSIGEIPSEWLAKYRHLFGLSESREDGLRVSRHHIALLDDLFGKGDKIEVDKKFEVARSWLKNFDGISERPIPESFQGELRPYQKAGFEWLHFLREAGFGGCLADDMGTGKTIQTLSFLLSLKEDWRKRNLRKRKKEAAPVHLLVVPRSLITNWQREAARFTPDLHILDYAHGDRAANTEEFDQYDIVLTTYGILLRDIDRLTPYQFDTAILDEAQAIKNPASESARAARQINSRHRLTLTGTPVENNTLELWSQFAFLNPGLLGSADYFREEFLGPIERQKDEQTTSLLRRLVYPFILRRTKDQVVSDLPPRTEKILWGEMEPDQRRFYNETRDHYRALLLKLIEEQGVKQARFRILEGLLRLRQICNHPKLVRSTHAAGSAKMEALLETLGNAQAEGHKTLVFSQFVQMLKLIEKELRRAGIPFAYLDGSTVNRQERVDQFQNNDNVRVFLISLKAGGVGLNLTAADYVIHVDPWWNPAVEMQATDRAHRIGQDKPVFVYKLMMKDSVEEKILQLQERKRALVTQLISTEAGFFKSLTADDIQGLFS